MFQKEESHSYSNSIVSQNEEIWNFPVQRSNGFLDSAHHQLPENASASYNLNNPQDILSQFFSGKSMGSNDRFTDHPVLADGVYASENSTYQLGAVDETFGFNELQESSKVNTDTQNFDPVYVVNPEFLNDDFGAGAHIFGNQAEKEHGVIEEKKTVGSQNQSEAFNSSHNFLNGGMVVGTSDLFIDQSFLDVSSGLHAPVLLEFPKQHSKSSHVGNSIGIERELGQDIFTQGNVDFYSELPEWKSSHETDKTLVDPEYFGFDLKRTKSNSTTSHFVECVSGLSDEHPDSRFSTPELSHSSGDSVIPKTSQLNHQFLSMKDVEISNKQAANGHLEHPSTSHPLFSGNGHNEQLVSPASLKQMSRIRPQINISRNLRNSSGTSKNDFYDTGPSSPSRRKKQRIEPKSIPSRFKVNPKSFIKLLKSVVKCLDVSLDYDGYTGIITDVVLNHSISNYYRNEEIDTLIKPIQMKRPICIRYHLANEERIESGYRYEHHDGTHSELHCHMGVVQRKIYIRDISAILNDVTHIKYHKSPNFNINNPYEPQYTRFETDESGIENNETKCGLCAYCKEVRFLPFKNSSYLSHMTLGHGVFADNFIIPEGINFGKYIVPRDKEHEPDKTKEIDGLQCPACLEIIEMSCWKTKANPLLKYFRHYKKEHVKDDKKRNNVKSQVNPLDFKNIQEE